MKAVDRSSKKQKSKKKPIKKPKKENVLIVAQEFKFAKLLSGNEKTTRDRVLKTLKRWLLNCFTKNYVFKEDDFVRVWKGLFYAVWMSDKPLIQEELCDNISHILDLFPNDQLENALMMTKAGFKVLATEWYGLDQHRVDKFMMLVRRYLRGSFRCLLRAQWDLEACKKYAKMLSSEDGILALKTPFYARNALSLILHIIDCFLEELAKISKGKISDESLLELLDPFLKQVCVGEHQQVCMASRQLLTDLLKQSELGLKYAGAVEAWKRMGCPAEGPDAFELVSDDEGDEQHTDEVQNSALDPRAGKVDVTLEPLPVPAQLFAERIRQHMARSASRAYKRANTCLQRFEKLSQSEYPLKIRTEEMEAPLPRGAKNVAARSLKALEKALVQSSDELSLRGLRRKHRKRLLAQSRAGLSIVDEVAHSNISNGEEEQDKVTSEAKTRNRKRKNKDTPKTDKRPKLEKTEERIKLNKTKNKKVSENLDKTRRKLKDETVNVLANKRDNKDIANDKNKPKSVIDADLKPKKSDNVARTERESRKPTNLNKINKKTAIKKQIERKTSIETPKKVKFVLKNNCMQGPVDYYKSVRQSPNIPFDSSKKPVKTNLKPSTPSPINPFFKKKLKSRKH